MSVVFISHRSVDSKEAELLASEIRKVGHSVWLDLWEFNAGISIIDKINEGLSNASHLVLCYSKAGIDSPWMKKEWQAALALQLNNSAIDILPIRLSGGEPPAILADVYFLDFVDNWNKAMSKLLQKLDI